MLLFSTRLPVNEKLTNDEFVKLVIQWNQGSQYDKMETINWDGVSKNVRFVEGRRSLAIEELRAHNIVAARFRKEDENGVIWTSDFVLNSNEKKIVIRLDRETTEDTIVFVPKFNAPYLVKMLIKDDYLALDKEFRILDEAIIINKLNYKQIEDIILKKERYMLPIVYVTKTWAGNYPLNVNKLSKRLQGVAHVLKEVDPDVSRLLKDSCEGKNVHHGGIGIYYPSKSASSKRFNSERYVGNEDALVEKIVRNVYRYSNQQIQERIYTWDGVQNELLSLRYKSLEKKRQEVLDENEELYLVFDEQLSDQARTIEEQNKRIAALEQENQGLRNKIDGMDEIPLLYYGEEDELYDGEIREIILDILANSLKGEKPKSRRNHIVSDILENNNFQNIQEKKRAEIKRIFKGYSGLTLSMKQSLRTLGFEVKSDNKHYKLEYYGDSRYIAMTSKTGSDYRAGENLISEINKNIL